jgi:hypothetical protein
MNQNQKEQVRKSLAEINRIHDNVSKLLPDAIDQLMIDYIYEALKIVGHEDVESSINNSINWDLQFEK